MTHLSRTPSWSRRTLRPTGRRRRAPALESLEGRITPSTVIDNGTPGFYAQLGNLLDGPDGTNLPEPQAASDPSLGTWLGASPPHGGSWSSSVQAIPTTWGNGVEESAVVYAVNGGSKGLPNLNVAVGANNGIYVWLDGAYKFGADSESPTQYQVPLGDVGPGTHYLQLLRENHAGPPDYSIEATADTPPPFQRLNDYALTYTDVDGDTAVVAGNAPLFPAGSDPTQFLTFVPSGQGYQLQGANLSGVAQGYDFRVFAATDQNLDLNADLFANDPTAVFRLRALRDANPATGADGVVNVGSIYSSKNMLKISVDGDLGAFAAGDPTDGSAEGLQTLRVGSLGLYTPYTAAAGTTRDSIVFGSVQTLNVLTDLRGSLVIHSRAGVAGDQGGILAGGGIGRDLTGRLITEGDLGGLTIGRNIFGSAEPNGGELICEGNLGPLPLRVKGSVIGGTTTASGVIEANHNADSIEVRGGVGGGSGDLSGSIYVLGNSRSIAVRGGVVGGSGQYSGQINAGSTADSIAVGGSVIGGSGGSSGSIRVGGNSRSIAVGGSVIGGSGGSSGFIQLGRNADSIYIGGSLLGGVGDYSGHIVNVITPHAPLSVDGSVVVHGAVLGGRGSNSGSMDLGVVSRQLSVGNVVGVRKPADSGLYSGQILVHGNVESLQAGIIEGGGKNGTGSIFILGNLNQGTIDDLFGSTGVSSGTFGVAGTIRDLTVTQGIFGGDGLYSGFLNAGAITRLTIRGNLEGGRGEGSGWINATSIASIAIGGDMFGSSGVDSGVVWAKSGTIGTMTIGGALVGGTGYRSGVISANKIGSLTISKGIFRPRGDSPFSGEVELNYLPRSVTARPNGIDRPRPKVAGTPVLGYGRAVRATVVGGNTLVSRGGGTLVSRGGGTLLSRGGGTVLPPSGSALASRDQAEAQATRSHQPSLGLLSRSGGTLVSRGGGT